jgi:hypothetical protein
MTATPPRNDAARDAIVAQRVVVEAIWLRVLGRGPVPRVGRISNWPGDRDHAIKCITTIEREAEIQANLGDDAPDLSASKMHPWVWQAARSLWQSGHFAQAVGVAAIKVNAETQNKVGRSDISETDLFNQAFSKDEPQSGKSRLRFTSAGNEVTAEDMRRGVRAFAEGCFAAIRNPLAHEGHDLPETEALEQLAALSVLARWVDRAEVRKA